MDFAYGWSFSGKESAFNRTALSSFNPSHTKGFFLAFYGGATMSGFGVSPENWEYFKELSTRPSKCPKFYTTMTSDGNEFSPKRAYILSKFKLPQIDVISILYTKINSLNKIPYEYLVNAL